MRKANQPAFRRSPFLVCYWEDGQLIFENYATGLRAAAAPVSCEVLDFFDDWRRAEGLFSHLNQYQPSSLRRAIRQLVRQSLLQCSDRKGDPVERLLLQWNGWNPAAGFLHFTTRDAPPVTDLFALEESAERLVRGKRMPAAAKRYPRARHLVLPPVQTGNDFARVLLARRTWRQFSREQILLSDLSTMLGLTFRVQEWVSVPHVGRFALKTSPSGGALHPIEAYVVARHVEGASPGLYHYDAQRHRLDFLRRGATSAQITKYLAGQYWFSDAAAVILMTAVFPRTQWKYPSARAYRVVLIEAGHLCQTFCLTATWMGLASFCTMALAESKIEKDLGLDGVTEGVLYAAGVGRTPLGKDWRTATIPESVRKKSRR